MIENIQEWALSLPWFLHWVGVLALGAIPFVESYLGSIIGVVSGLNPVVAVVAAVIGNVVSMLAFVFGAHGIRSRVTRDREQPPRSPRTQKVKDRFDRYGVAGVSLLGQLVLPSQITSALIVSFGATRNLVIFWQVVSIVLWGIVCGVLAVYGINLLAEQHEPNRAQPRRARSSASSVMPSTARFSSRCSSDAVPGISKMRS
ncbi:hypothetical protein BJF85_02325 [Saccharomonospora sp. CUA-673]|uniref:hypothetical protein n=1 Tax=Saccharomonospora sp. CUA-673 TaxID=1904969 RepID=UPI0009596AE9|nr:hypothetical protein [Saccharomonospora sp. CUA-673]OLT45235.1 hypothetical protein BJF85_02325 [Saccharomonospora sp. CUA-673]